ncbi:MAG: N-acetyl-gamma-glutamyl-phosphate reductase [Steroidobacter sp.]
MNKVPTIVLGGTGYVAGELLRLIAAHPHLELQAILSDSQPGEAVAKAFPHLAVIYPTLKYSSLEEVTQLVKTLPRSAILAAAPHGVSHKLLDGLISASEQAGTKLTVVDISADYRYSTAAAYEAVYKHAHGAPERIKDFTCALPEHLAKASTLHVSHPGCFATSMLLASVPLLKLGLIEPRIFVAGVTGSTGSGRTPVAGTHHPQRQSDLYTYNALSHRHSPEVVELAQAASGIKAEVNFVPHSGPFARGIHATIQATAIKPVKNAELVEALQSFYKHSPFIRVSAEMPRIKDVATSNYAHMSAVANGNSIAVMCAIDNLVKGAAGGAVQWLNRLLGFDETTGLIMPAPGWT